MIEFLGPRLRDASHVVVFTGAGVSAESGIPTFRDAMTGLWERFDPAALATANAFRNDPALVWGWYEWRRSRVLAAKPNPAHLAIAELARRVTRLTVVTQNVDDLHERAGCHDVIHLHGSLHSPRCFACARPYEQATDPLNEPGDGRRVEPPRCRHCNGKVRPGVVWFGEALPEQAWREALAAAEDCDLLLSVGTSGLVQPAAKIPLIAREHGALVVHVNLQRESIQGEREFSLVGKAAEILPRLLAQASA
ncbi:MULTISPECIES: NAD-dependent deacylase [unclassified Pseudomonas]|uniref:SIR2 family NAD-dependent protein deacylase n=1 Tax=unclassified Pseudomonas TaxID=196821 RepID=UPI000871413F|nr:MULTISPECIES: NAD-dependent deacylase [unclassified Pseudomonas]SCW81580.1 NAD-dependent deacetylase [Pseudomonas sp. NFACC05-1]SCZ33377.1 NAD-dependent deacetylase [Pseudomonas sp. NFACC44-2]SDA79967.1 NAD-dependent deacetylase [Pseudomonas sp. NFACC51]SDB09105.1 NAD-dependent deacetylase [Pseudomonas sp. NFACC17-2]SEJ03554.1 NAD-dependent deacetylase [Pseudomonas sp. NFACC23-1]